MTPCACREWRARCEGVKREILQGEDVKITESSEGGGRGSGRIDPVAPCQLGCCVSG